ncbi:hypothetical protein [Escherichia coli]|uniref:hypothetical protein n=1 Tax=Escherichia coli TaxID=562 RepID=UPI0004D8EB2B|nr:hypothetical protein [Escherichia coli]AUO57349.1 hypothetical protein C1I23_11910 [Escherichia coli]EEV8135572.1 hypothetical protein [Escherichia coli]EFC7229306.1 hypothetical protein [Escherichia coli]EFF9451208.1 hypothetical protein [Escherichia coli]EFG1579254.1 hypothetical protein [Escherichia coli]
MSEKIAVVYIGPKPVKKDTLTGSRTLFPRLEPVHVDSALAWQLLAFPEVWIRHEELDGVLKKQQQDGQLRQAQQEQERALAAREEAESSFVVPVNGENVDLSKLTSARLATLCEAEELNIHKDPKETADAFRIRVREAFRRRVAETEQHGGTD